MKIHLIKWSNSTHNLVYGMTTNGEWAAIFAPRTGTGPYLIICNFGGHPEVVTSQFCFVNSDGSTSDRNIPLLDDDDIVIQQHHLDEVKSFIKNKTLEYIFEQRHIRYIVFF